MASEQPFEMDAVVSEVEQRLAGDDGPVEIAVLGNATVGIGEARDADFGITGAGDAGIIFAKGQPLSTTLRRRRQSAGCLNRSADASG